MVTPAELTVQVRDALTHLYDNVYLQNHPLADLLAIGPATGPTTRAKRLREVLVEMVEELKPTPAIPFGSREWRGYRILYQLYIEGITPSEVMDELGLASSHFYRERQKALEALAGLVWDRQPDAAGKTWDVTESEEGTPDVFGVEVERLAAGSTQEQLQTKEVLQEVLSLTQALAARRGVRLTLELPGALPSIYMDRAVLGQIVSNALFQALKRVPSGRAIVITATAEGPYVRLEIGPQEAEGGPWDAQELTPLALARRLAESQGGHIEVTEQGAIHIALPIAPDTTVLIVDDNEDIIALFGRYLHSHGYQVVGARGFQEALRLASEVRPQVITLDVMMPHRDGWETLRALKDNPETHHIPIVVCSVVDEPELSLALGAQEHLTKPITEETLLAALERWRGQLVLAGSPEWPPDTSPSR